jgi:hypothetical protein
MREDRPLDLNAAVPAMLCCACGVVGERETLCGRLLARPKNNIMREDARAVSSAALASGSMLHRSHTTLRGNDHTVVVKPAGLKGTRGRTSFALGYGPHSATVSSLEPTRQ